MARPDALVDVYTGAPASRGGQYSTTSLPDYLDLKSSNEVFADVAAYTPMFGALSTEKPFFCN